MPSIKEFETWMTPAGAGRRIGISKQAVHKLLENGRFRAARTNAGWLLDPASVEEYREARAERFGWRDGDVAMKRGDGRG